MEFIYQSIPIASLRRIPVYLQSSANGQPVAGVIPSGAEMQISKNGAAWVNATGTWTEISGAGSGKGGYYYVFPLSEIDTPGFLKFKVEKSGIHQFMFAVEIRTAWFGSVVADAGNTALTFKTDLASTQTDHWRYSFATFWTGTLAGQTRRVDAYNGTTKFLTLLSGHAYSSAPSNGDVFQLVNA